MSEIDQILAELEQSFPGIQYVRGIKTGKEATVHLVQSMGREMALKVYKRDTKFSSRKQYFNQQEILDSREGRAIRNNSQFGKKVMLSVWAYREYDTIRRLLEDGAAVPEVYKVADNYLLMEFIGQSGVPTPQLYTQRLSSAAAQDCFQQILTNIEIFWLAGYVHGDLSAYNILWDGQRATVIDFPQVVKLSQSATAPNKLLRDIDNVDSYFRNYDIPAYEQSLSMLRGLGESYF